MSTANKLSDLKAAQSPENATVPLDAPILPAQAFVDNAVSLLNTSALSLPSKGLTHFAASLFITVMDVVAGFGGFVVADLSGNAIPAADINAILAACVANSWSVPPAGENTLDLSGGTNAAPTGQGLTDKATLIGAGWTVTTN